MAKSITLTNIDSAIAADLRVALTARGLSGSGNRAALHARLLEALQLAAPPASGEEQAEQATTTTEEPPVVVEPPVVEPPFPAPAPPAAPPAAPTAVWVVTKAVPK